MHQMSNAGVSWWQSTVVSGPSTSPEQGVGDASKHYVLFETFERNARKHEVLRVSWSDGNKALEGTYGHDEVFFGNGFARGGAEDMSREMRSVIEVGKDGTVTVKANSDAVHGYEIVIQLYSTTSDIKLELKVDIATERFVDRMMSYMKHVETQLHSDLDRMQSRLMKHGMLQKRVDEAVRKKQEEDLKIEVGVRLLMNEKRSHWKGRG